MSPTRLEPVDAPDRAELDTQGEVDLMILDYLACLAIDRSLCAVESPDSTLDDESEWHAQTTAAFQSLVAQHNTPLPEDLAVKLQILALANRLRCYLPARPDRDPASQTLPKIGLEFMDLCSSATSKVSETRWFDVGARILAHAARDEQAKGNSPSHDLNQLYSWSSNNHSHQMKWEKARSEYLAKPPLNRTVDTQSSELELSKLKDIILRFLVDLVNTLDQPILVQLERGKLWDLSALETHRLKERVGLS